MNLFEAINTVHAIYINDGEAEGKTVADIIATVRSENIEEYAEYYLPCHPEHYQAFETVCMAAEEDIDTILVEEQIF